MKVSVRVTDSNPCEQFFFYNDVSSCTPTKLLDRSSVVNQRERETESAIFRLRSHVSFTSQKVQNPTDQHCDLDATSPYVDELKWPNSLP
jgi:hypothetical protein